MVSGSFLISHEKGNTNKVEPQVLSHPLSIQIADVCKLRNARYGGTRGQVEVRGGVVCPRTPLTPIALPMSFLSNSPQPSTRSSAVSSVGGKPGAVCWVLRRSLPFRATAGQAPLCRSWDSSPSGACELLLELSSVWL